MLFKIANGCNSGSLVFTHTNQMLNMFCAHPVMIFNNMHLLHLMWKHFCCKFK